MSRSVLIFYHIYCYGDWQTIVREQLLALQKSGVYDECIGMFARVIGSPESIKEYYDIISSMKKIHTIQADDNNNHEISTLRATKFFADETFPYREYIRDLDMYVLYLHTKGVYSSRENSIIASRMDDWRKLMEHFVINQWRICVKHLDDGYDVCGVNWREQSLFGPIVGHFSGNFWWAKLSYIFKLPEVKDDWDRAYYEFWIGQSNPKAMCLHESGVDHYHTNYPENKYREILCQ